MQGMIEIRCRKRTETFSAGGRSSVERGSPPLERQEIKEPKRLLEGGFSSDDLHRKALQECTHIFEALAI